MERISSEIKTQEEGSTDITKYIIMIRESGKKFKICKSQEKNNEIG